MLQKIKRTFTSKWRVTLMISCLLGSVLPIWPSAVSADSVTAWIEGNYHDPIFGPSNDFFYVRNDSLFQKIRTSDFEVISSVPLSTGGHLVLDPSGTYAYAQKLSRLVKINLTTLTITEIQVDPIEIIRKFEIDSLGTYGYVSGSKSNGDDDNPSTNNFVVKIDLSSGAVTGTLQGFEDMSPYGIALNEAQNFGCVTDDTQGVLRGFTINPFQWSQHCNISFGVNPSSIEFDGNKTFGYVSGGSESGGSKLLKFNVASGAIIKTLTFPRESNLFRINPASTFLYMTEEAPSPSVLYKISLSTFEIVEEIPIPGSNTNITISPNGLVGVVDTGDGLAKVNLSPSAPQSISFVAPTSKLTATRTVALNGTASSTLPVIYSSTTPTVCAISGAVVNLLDEGDCTVVAAQNGSAIWDPAASVTRTFKVFLSPPSANTGISISAGRSFSNSKFVSLEITWPEFADGVRLSNDAGFGSAVTVTKKLSPTTSWVLDDSVRGVSKVVYARFTGEGIDTNKTYSDDIILGAIAPSLTSKKSASAKSIAVFAKLKVLSTSKVSLKVVRSSMKYCKVLGTTLKGFKAGSCKVTVTVTPKKGRATSKTVTLKVAK
jgi:hypothetical protein